jgi:RNA polymerase sigma factor (sigma-70 family)
MTSAEIAGPYWPTCPAAALVGTYAPRIRPFLTAPPDTILATLMAAAQAGDAAAYRALLRECAPIAAATARRLAIPPHLVDDVVQETLLTVHRARATYDPARPFLPWLRAIAQRRALDSRRAQGRRAAHETVDELAYLNHPGTEPEPGSVIDRADLSALLAAAIARLPPGQRQAVELLALRENSLAEAASLTGRNTGALKVNLHRAIQALRGHLGKRADV